MPTYVYECKKCGHQFEVLQSITDPPRKRCPKCRSAVRRVLMPGGGLIFHGTGFYITDYKRKENPGGQNAPEKLRGGAKNTTKNSEKRTEQDGKTKRDGSEKS